MHKLHKSIGLKLILDESKSESQQTGKLLRMTNSGKRSKGIINYVGLVGVGQTGV